MGNERGPTVGIRSLAVAYPSEVRTNDYYRTRYPEVVASAEGRTLAQVFAPVVEAGAGQDPWEAELAPFLGDPFRGTVRRRVLGPGETALELELAAARGCLAARGMDAREVDLCLVSALRPDTFGVGDAAFLARALGLTGAAWNIESACSSPLVGLQTACALVKAGDYANVLVVASCTYSRDVDEADTLAWFLADGAGAFLVSAAPTGTGVLATKVLNTADTCGVFSHRLELDAAGHPVLRMHAGKGANRVLRDSSSAMLEACCSGVLAQAGVARDAVDFFVFNTPTAWYASYAARRLGVDPRRTLSTYADYANIGPALMPTNLYRAAATGRIRPGDLVLVFTIGSVSTAGAALMRWGEVCLGPDPERAPGAAAAAGRREE